MTFEDDWGSMTIILFTVVIAVERRVGDFIGFPSVDAESLCSPFRTKFIPAISNSFGLNFRSECES